MTKKIELLRSSYGGLPYVAGSILEVEDAEGTFAINSGAAIYANDDALVTPVPTTEQVTMAAETARKNRESAMTPEQRRKDAAARKKKEEEAAARKKEEEEDARLKKEDADKAAKEAAHAAQVHPAHPHGEPPGQAKKPQPK